ISGAAETYWGKNKGRSMEGILVKVTTALVVVFLLVSLLLNIPALSL
ncbi:MAG: preprotein translocase subunit SecG, partial [Lachnospiraceae bacterium]|nr:preprotein translocase subunit SecG [Lachnospiraceae bacterium]